ncbi:MAG: DUF1570 domain-containing protein [Verrucomicrobiota bacterium]
MASLKTLTFLGILLLAPAAWSQTDTGIDRGEKESRKSTGVTKRPPPWPRDFKAGDAPISQKKRESGGETWFSYQSRGPELLANDPITKKDLKELMKVVNSVQPAIRRLPLPLLPDEDEGRRRTSGRVRLFSTRDGYEAAGGLPGTVGLFQPRRRETLILRPKLFGEDLRSNMNETRSYDLVVHEMAHQVLSRWNRVLPPWINEGLAEYFAAAHIAPGQYRFHRMETEIIDHVKRYLGKRRAELSGPDIQTVLSMSNRTWNTSNRPDSDKNYEKYGVALVLIHHFFHRDGGNGEAMRRYLKALQSGRRSSEATQEFLLRDRPTERLEADLQRYWRQNGLRLTFH